MVDAPLQLKTHVIPWLLNSKTEQYWCPIKHRKKLITLHARYVNFVDYGQGEDYRAKEKKLRKLLRPKNLKNTA